MPVIGMGVIYQLLKHFGIILFGILMLLQAGGLQHYYKATQVYANWSMHQKIARGNAHGVQMVITEVEYKNSIVEKDELRINGVLYDVLKVQSEGQLVNLTVVADTFEGSVLTKLHGLINNWHSNESILPQFLVDLLGSVYLLPDLLTISHPLIVLSDRVFSDHNDLQIFESYPVLVQPPNPGFVY
jgi:hypothetical protein